MAADGARRAGRGTVRFRVTALAALVTAIVLGTTAVVLVVVQRRVLTSSLDETLTSEAAALATEVGETGGGAPSGDGTLLSAPRIDDDAVAQVVAGGEVVAASRPSLTGTPLTDVDVDRPTVRSVDDVPGGDGSFRVAVHPVEGGTAAGSATGDASVIVGAPLDDIVDSTRLLATSLAVAVPTVTAVLAALVWALIGRTLRPVEAIRREVAHISGADLRRRVPEPRGDDEVARLARTMNAMLERLDDAAERQRRFVGDASHELRTPLTRIRSDIEIDLAHPETADATATERRVLDEAVGMQHLVDDLLHLARSDAGDLDGDRSPTRRDAVAVDELVAAEVDRVRQGSPVAVVARRAGYAPVAADAADLRRAVANLLDNAVRHARTRVEASVSVTVDGQEPDGTPATSDRAAGTVVVTVADDGPGVPPGDAERIFERFARLDDARARADGGAGLGLAIARDIAARHGGTVDLDPGHGGGARFVLRLPLAESARGARPRTGPR